MLIMIDCCSKKPIALGLCSSCYKKQYRLKNRDKLLQQERAQYKNNRSNRLISQNKHSYSIKGRYGYMKNDASYRGLLCNLTLEQYVELISKPCNYCERPLPKSSCTGLDRIDNSKGYDHDNVLPCCGFCNKIRMNQLTVEETKIAVLAILKFRQEKAT